jgi:CRISPR-associated protein Cas1
MRTVYVTHQAATIRREGGVIAVNVKGARVAQVSVHDLSQLVVMGNVVLTPAALDLLVEKGVDTVFLTHSGRYRGRITHGLSGSVKLRLSQYDMLCDPASALDTARNIVAAKIANMRVFLLRFSRRRGRTERQQRSLASMLASAARLDLAATLDEVRGCEGSATASYFRCFGDAIEAEGFSFDGRNRRPPLDPVNALLSLGYTLLANTVEAAVNVVGLDPYVGTLHAVEANRPSLVCDLEEEFRAVVVDAVVVAAINKRVMQQGDFEDAGPGEPVFIRREAVSRFVGLIERRLRSPVTYEPQGVRLAWRQVIEQQVRAFARFVLGTAERYEPYRAR